MPQRIPHDHPTVETVRVTLSRYGRTRSRLSLPDDDRFPPTTTRLVLDSETYHTRIESGNGPEIKGAYDNARLACEHTGKDRLEAWRTESDIDYGRSLLVDIVEPGFLYGIREPGERAVYEVVESPDDSLAAIARDLDG